MFWHKKKLTSDEHEQLTKRLITVEADLQRVRNILDNLGSSVHSLRGLVNRKLGGKFNLAEEEPQPRGIDDGFDELRKLNKDNPSLNKI